MQQLYRAQWTVNGELNWIICADKEEAHNMIPWTDINASNFRIVPITDPDEVLRYVEP